MRSTRVPLTPAIGRESTNEDEIFESACAERRSRATAVAVRRSYADRPEPSDSTTPRIGTSRERSSFLMTFVPAEVVPSSASSAPTSLVSISA
jgi:hypothetical protein